MNDRRSRNLDAVLAAAAAPPLPEEEDAQALANVLTMFHTAGIAAEAGVAATEPITAHSPVESTAPGDTPAVRSTPRVSFVMKCAFAFVFVLGISIAISSTGVLPSPVQSFVHHMFGGIGVPAPPTTQNSGTPSGTGSAPANPLQTVSTGPDSVASASPLASQRGSNGAGAPTASAPAAGVASASPSATEASLYTLCTEVKGSGNSWKTTMSVQDQDRLIAAAGGENKVHAYCNQLLKSGTSSSDTTTVTPSPSPSAAD